ncbi:MAG: hypothetical protein ABR537_09640 [Gemmatimonadales bacterium]
MLLVGLVVVWPCRLFGQISLSGIVGARYTSTLVRDSVVTSFDVRPAIGPSIALAMSEQSRTGWTPGAALDISWAALQRHDSAGATKINSLTTIAFTVGLQRTLSRQLAARVGVGALKYLPGERAGLFRSGSGIAALGMAGLDWTPAVTAARGIGLSLRYDAHRFTTAALRSEGFTAPRLVHRIAIGVRARIAGS